MFSIAAPLYFTGIQAPYATGISHLHTVLHADRLLFDFFSPAVLWTLPGSPSWALTKQGTCLETHTDFCDTIQYQSISHIIVNRIVITSRLDETIGNS